VRARGRLSTQDYSRSKPRHKAERDDHPKKGKQEQPAIRTLTQEQPRERRARQLFFMLLAVDAEPV